MPITIFSSSPNRAGQALTATASATLATTEMTTCAMSIENARDCVDRLVPGQAGNRDGDELMSYAEMALGGGTVRGERREEGWEAKIAILGMPALV